MLKEEIIAKLGELGIEHDPSALKPELLALLPEDLQKTEADEEVPEDSEAKKKFRALIETYKKQNPVKYAVKESALLAKLETL